MLYQTAQRNVECLVVEPSSIQGSAADCPISLIFDCHVLACFIYPL